RGAGDPEHGQAAIDDEYSEKRQPSLAGMECADQDEQDREDKQPGGARHGSVLQWRKDDRLIRLTLPLGRHRRNSVIGARKAIELARIEEDVVIVAKLIQIAPEPGIDNIFARWNHNVEDGAIFKSIHGKR